MNNYSVCPTCGYKLLKAGEGSSIELFCPKCSQKMTIEIIEFDIGKYFTTMKEYFPTAHIESRMRQLYLADEFGGETRTVKVTYIYGAARLGKTSFVYDNYPIQDICRVNNYERGTFETYNAQKVLVLDEFTGGGNRYNLSKQYIR